MLREALALWRGDAYAEFADEDWARPEAQRLEELRLVAHERLVEAELACGRAAEMIPEIESLAGEHPLREAFRAQLMIALYRAGRQADALRVVPRLPPACSSRSSASSRRRRWSSSSGGCSPTTRRCCSPSRRGCRCAAIASVSGSAPVATAPCSPPACPGSSATSPIRVIREEIADCPEFVRSFEATAHRVASLRHPAIVADPRLLARARGRLPRDAPDARRDAGRPAGARPADRPPQLATLVSRVGGALVAAADAGIVHGRVTPEQRAVRRRRGAVPRRLRARPGRSEPDGGDDVHDFAVHGRSACLGERRGDRSPTSWPAALATAGRPPMAELVPMLVAALSRHRAAPPTRRLPNPYKGLRAFDEADAADFFGRADLVDEILARLGRDDLRGRLVLVVGGSGTGKSSVVRAGLLPRVRRGDVPGSEQWFVTTMLPGSSPFKELAESLRRVAVGETTGLADAARRRAEASTGCCAVSCPATASCCWSSTSSRSCSPWPASRTSGRSSTA